MKNNTSSEQTLIILKWAMIGSVGMYIALGFLLVKESTPLTIQEAVSKPVVMALSGLGLAALIAGRKIPSLIGKGNTGQANFTRVILELAIYESAAVFGLVLTVLEQSHQFILAFGIATILQQVRVTTKTTQ